MSAHLLPAVRDLVVQHLWAARLSLERVAALLWILCCVPDEEDAPPGTFEVADALEVPDVERGLAA